MKQFIHCLSVHIYNDMCIFTQYNIGSRVGAVVRALAFHQCVPGSIHGPGVILGAEFVGSLLWGPFLESPGKFSDL